MEKTIISLWVSMMFFQLYIENVEHVHHTKVSYKILKDNPPPIKSESQIQWGTLNKPSNENDLNQVLKLAEELRIT